MSERFAHWAASVNWTVVAVCTALLCLGMCLPYILILPRYLVMAAFIPIIGVGRAYERWRAWASRRSNRPRGERR